jgi:hypothetical protein
VIIVVWVLLMQILLGAEFTKVYAAPGLASPRRSRCRSRRKRAERGMGERRP